MTTRTRVDVIVDVRQGRHRFLVPATQVRIEHGEVRVVHRDGVRRVIELVEIVEGRDLQRLGDLATVNREVDLSLARESALKSFVTTPHLNEFTSMMSISGTPRPTETSGPAWSSPAHVHADILCPGRLRRVSDNLLLQQSSHYDSTPWLAPLVNADCG